MIVSFRMEAMVFDSSTSGARLPLSRGVKEYPKFLAGRRQDGVLLLEEPRWVKGQGVNYGGAPQGDIIL